MTAFDEFADRVLLHVAEGLNLTEACARAGVPYSTARKWVTAGRRAPGGKYGPFAAALDAGPVEAGGEDLGVRELGEVERQVEELVAGRELVGEPALAAAQARTLARAIDELAGTCGGAAGVALATTSRRLEEVVAAIALPIRDELTELKERHDARRAADGRWS